MEKAGSEISITSSKLSLGIQIGDFFVIPTDNGLKLINIEKQTISSIKAKEIEGVLGGGKLFHASIVSTGPNSYKLLFTHGKTIQSVVFNPLNFIERIHVENGAGTVTSGSIKIVFTDHNQVGQKL